MQLNATTVIPTGPTVAYTITRPAGCTPATTSTDTATFSITDLDLGALSTPPKGFAIKVAPVSVSGGHCGLAFNCYGSQVLTPEVFGAGVGFWTNGNGIYFDASGSIYAEVWHVDPGTTEASGAWSDAMAIGNWTAGHTYQVEAMLSLGGEWTISVRDLSYALDWAGQPNNNAMNQFFSTNASAASGVPADRIHAKSVKGRTARVSAFTAGVGCTITVTPVAIYN